MIGMMMFMLTAFSLGLPANEVPGHRGCGEYILKGSLQKNTNQEKNTPVVYVINAGTTSEMRFIFSAAEDLSVMASYLDTPTVIKASLLKKMDGTKGELKDVKSVELRRPNPLSPLKDSGLFLQTSSPCL